jgi:hypothetical protein
MITWLFNKINFLTFVVDSIFGCDNLHYSSCDFYDYVIEKIMICIITTKKYN